MYLLQFHCFLSLFHSLASNKCQVFGLSGGSCDTDSFRSTVCPLSAYYNFTIATKTAFISTSAFGWVKSREVKSKVGSASFPVWVPWSRETSVARSPVGQQEQERERESSGQLRLSDAQCMHLTEQSIIRCEGLFLETIHLCCGHTWLFFFFLLPEIFNSLDRLQLFYTKAVVVVGCWVIYSYFYIMFGQAIDHHSITCIFCMRVKYRIYLFVCLLGWTMRHARFPRDSHASHYFKSFAWPSNNTCFSH